MTEEISTLGTALKSLVCGDAGANCGDDALFGEIRRLITIARRAHSASLMTNEAMRLRFGEMSAREIAAVKAVLKNVLNP